MELTDTMREAGASGHAERLERARAGDTAAYRAVVEARLAGSWRLARAILGSDEAASEAVVTAVTAAWRELPRLANIGRFDDWFDRILLAECRMRLASRGGTDPGAPASAPADLLGRALLALEQSPPQAAPPPAARTPGRRRAVATWLALLAGVVGVAVIGVLLVRPRELPTTGVGATGAPSDGVGASSSTPPSSPAGTATPSPVPSGAVAEPLRVGSIAMVTLHGNGLRVRSAPRVSDDSALLKPLLPAGTRMLIVDGPVAKDTYEWYEVQTDGEPISLFGWVAVGDAEGSWIAPAEPRCYPTLDATALTSLTAIEFLACYGTAEVRVQAKAASLGHARGEEGACGWVRRRDGCEVDRAWLLLPPATVTVITASGEGHELRVALPPDMAAELVKLPRRSSLLLTLAVDDPAAAGCRIRDAASGRSLLPDARAVTACRLQPVIQEMTIRVSEESGSGS